MIVWLLACAMAEEVPAWSGDLAITYGRNFGQQLNVGGVVGELKYNVHPQAAAGVRIGTTLGAGIDRDGVRGYIGLPLLVKVEGFPSVQTTRPFAGLGVGTTLFNAGGVVFAQDGFEASGAAYGVTGPLFTLLPELGVDLGAIRISLSHGFLVGSAKGIAASIEASAEGAEFSDDFAYPGLGGTMLQVGVHLGGPKAQKAQ